MSISIPLLAHHGGAACNMKQPVVLKNAVVTQCRWINPHPLIVVDYKDDRGHAALDHGDGQHAGSGTDWLEPNDIEGRGRYHHLYLAKQDGPDGGAPEQDYLADGTLMRDTQTGADNGGRADTDVGR
jgi:hypothetical protein